MTMDAHARWLAQRRRRAALLARPRRLLEQEGRRRRHRQPQRSVRRIERRLLLGDLGQRRHRLRQQQRLPAVRRLPGRHRLRAARRARAAQQRPHRHACSTCRCRARSSGPRSRDLARQLGRGSIGNFVERQLPFVSRELDAGDDLRRRQRRQRRRQRHRGAAWAAATRSAGAPRSPTGFGRDIAAIVDGIRIARPERQDRPAQPAQRRRPALCRHRPRDQLRILQAISVRFAAEANVQRRAACWWST